MTKVIITGANGQTGREIVDLVSKYPEIDFTFTGRPEMDISNKEKVDKFFDEASFDYCINCAAYTAVDKAEEDKLTAAKVNIEAVQNLAVACERNTVRLLHISTDYVYGGSFNRPMVETDDTCPRSIYANTKLAGERAAQEICRQTLILRTSWVYSSYGHNFVKTMIRLGRERDELNVVFDQIGTPTYAYDLANAMLELILKIESGKVDASLWKGIYHYSNEGVCSWYDFAVAIMELSGLKCEIHPILSSQYPTAADRPHFSVLDKAKIKATFGLEISHWRSALKHCLQKL